MPLPILRQQLVRRKLVRNNDAQLGTPEILFKDTTANIEAIATPVEGMKAYSTDDHLEGYYNGSEWVWSVVGSGDVIGNGAVTDGHLAVFDDDVHHIKDGGAVPTAGVARSGATTDGHIAVWNGSSADSIKDGGALSGGGNVSDKGATTADHLAIWNGTNDHTIKDGGAVPAGGGDVLGPATSADNTISRYNGTDNKTIQGSLASVVDSGGINIPTGQTYNINGSPHTHSASLMNYICIQDQKAQNNAGGTFTSGAWRTRDLNTELADTGNNASVASNQITLDAGTYRCLIICPAGYCEQHQARLQNITDAETLLVGTSARAQATLARVIVSTSTIIGRFTLAAQKVLEVQHICNTTRSTDGLGEACNFTTEVYTVAEFWKE